MPKPSIKEHRLYLLKFAEFDPPLKGFLPSLILSMTLTLCQNPASMNTDFAFSNLTEINPCWKRFVPSQIHRLWPTLERILTFWCSQNSTHLLERMLNFSNLQNWIPLRKDSYPDTMPKPSIYEDRFSSSQIHRIWSSLERILRWVEALSRNLHPVLTFEQLAPPAWSHDKMSTKAIENDLYSLKNSSVQIRAWIKKKSHQTFKEETISSKLQKRFHQIFKNMISSERPKHDFRSEHDVNFTWWDPAWKNNNKKEKRKSWGKIDERKS